MKRRELLKSGAAISIGSGGLLFGAGQAAAQTTDYKALVCIYLSGGNDGINMIPPVDATLYDLYSKVRGPLALPLSGTGAIVPLDAQVGLHAGLAPLKAAWTEGAMTTVFNVGPLARPLTQQEFFNLRSSNDPSKVPEALFSHSDQTKHWQTGTTSSTSRTGWAGRVMDALSNTAPVLSVSGNTIYGAGSVSSALVLPGNPGSGYGLNNIGTDVRSVAKRSAIDSLVNAPSTNVMQNAFASIQKTALQRSGQLQPILQQRPTNATTSDPANADISAAFGNLAGVYANNISRQLYQVAKLIKNRTVVGGSRHIFYVSMGGFDTHTGQLAAHADLLTTLGSGLSAFYAAMKAIGMAPNVTAFTESDFGRTFKPNSSSGTDHAWGNQHIVVGGAVNGGKTYGTYPNLVLGGTDDAGKNTWDSQGRWIPTLSVDQYAGTLLKWFAPTLDANTIFPNLANFALKDVGFMKIV
jgi:uncharacterized protein (DUF1501 family)